MPGKLIGSENCMIVDILDTIKITGPTDFSQLGEKWSSLARRVGATTAKIDEIRNKRLLSQISLEDTFHELLNIMMAVKGEGATIEYLMVLLENDGMKSYADALDKTFLQTTGSSGSSFREFITDNLPELMAATILHPTVIAVLKSKRVLSDDDDAALQALLNAAEKKKLFYDFMQTKPNCYIHMLVAFREQSGVIEILKKFENN